MKLNQFLKAPAMGSCMLDKMKEPLNLPPYVF